MENKSMLFETATRKKFRFPYRGKISTEDLWDLSVNHLDEIYKSLNKEMKDSCEDSLLETPSAENEDLAMKIEIIKHIVGVKKAEKEARITEIERADMRRKIMEVKAQRENEKLVNMSDEDLDKMLEDLK